MITCPHCQIEQRGRFFAKPDSPYTFRSDDLVVEDEDVSEGLAIMVATDMPVHLSFFGTSVDADEHFRSPFFYLMGQLGAKPIMDLMPRIEKLRHIRENWYPPLRRAAGAYARRDSVGLRNSLKSLPGGREIDWANRDPYSDFEVATTQIFEPFEDSGMRTAASRELLQLAGETRRNCRTKLRGLLDDYRSALTGHRGRVVDVVFSALGDLDALYPAMWVEVMEARVNLEEYRVMRDDFNARKMLYQDLFELGSRTLAFTAPIANLVKRGAVNLYADGTRRTLQKARKEKASVRESWLADFPVAKVMYENMSRNTRNDFGHALARHDAARDVLVFDDGREQRYLLFLVDTVAALRLSHYLLDVLYIVDILDRSFN